MRKTETHTHTYTQNILFSCTYEKVSSGFFVCFNFFEKKFCFVVIFIPLYHYFSSFFLYEEKKDIYFNLLFGYFAVLSVDFAEIKVILGHKWNKQCTQRVDILIIITMATTTTTMTMTVDMMVTFDSCGCDNNVYEHNKKINQQQPLCRPAK